ncbi:MAG TPA: hypothetical protein PLL77_03355 [Pyrinomonadaceae bacterium]|nr:hypothetical protein [Pyrinomonadaceae bacterium]
MATLHQQYIDFNSKIRLTDTRFSSLKTSRKDLRKKIRKWFRENKPDELKPKFGGQGSTEMDTTVNPIPVTDAAGKELLKYDLDDGVYFLEKDGEDNRQTVETWRDWLYSSVDGHTATPPLRHKACIRVIFSDGHHIDLPLYYKNGEIIELAHKDDGWLESDPKAFYDWFNDESKGKPQLKRIVRFLKAWKNFQENENANTFVASGFSLSILAVNNYKADDNDDMAFQKTITAIRDELKRDFKCLRPTTPAGEDVFDSYTNDMKDKFLARLDELAQACDDAQEEMNQRKASEFLRAQFGQRFPLGADEDETQKSNRLASAMGAATIRPIPYSR